jgi:membrane-associated phospholipid phosphatase
VHRTTPRTPRRVRALTLALLPLALTVGATSRPLGAQDADSAAQKPVPPVGRHMLRITVALGATTAALLPMDRALTRAFRAPGPQNSRILHNTALVFDAWGAPGSQVAGPALFLAGRIGRSPSLTDVGMHVTEAYAAAAISVLSIKAVAGRARPFTVEDARPYDFKLGRGFPHRGPFSSFPSGHTTGSFAFASALTSEAGQWWPRRQRLIGTLAYGAAVLDGVSRVYRDGHWASDVAAGALVGTLNGLMVSRYQHAHPDNRIDALARRVLFVPSPDGRLNMGFSTRF